MSNALEELLNTKEEIEIKELIYEFRGKQVMLDSDLAKLFEVETRQLNQQMKRNISRFPEDFCFKLNFFEFKILTSQNVISSYGGRRHIPYVYTEHGIIALPSLQRT
ncbi:MAG: ORF6N domain-containing protein [Bacilli bacterium]|nr:ORF6N domain-containing protein [Bacilli bacterium]